MQILIKHQTKKRLHLRLTEKKRLNPEEIAQLQGSLQALEAVKKIKIYPRIAEFAVFYEGERQALLDFLAAFHFTEQLAGEYENFITGVNLSREYKEALISTSLLHFASKMLPFPIRAMLTTVKALAFIKLGFKSLWARRFDVAILDATAITASLLRRDYKTAASVIYLLTIGELLEEWTHKKSIDDLAKNTAIQVDRVWRKLADGSEVEVPLSAVQENDILVLRTGSLIPVDGEVIQGEGMVNQAALTGESIPVLKDAGKTVYAGTALEEGRLEISVDQAIGNTRYERIVAMIEESEKLKSAVQSKAEHLADRLVPFSFLGAALTFLLTRNVNRALAFLMVDFSCALKLSMPLSVLSAMNEATSQKIIVKGGKFLEACAEAEVIVFDKTGTLTKATPQVAEVIPFGHYHRDELLRIAACLEEHFPHSMASAVVQQAQKENLTHDEMHSNVEYIIAHGIASAIEDKRVLIGSAHFLFDDEGVPLTPQDKEKLSRIPDHYSHLYMSIDHRLEAVICIEDPIREEAKAMVSALKELGIRPVMMTGDSYRTVKAVAEELGFEEFFAEVLPEDKASYIQKEKELGRKVIMIGDGINDSPALSASDAGIAMQDSSSLAQQISDITISSNNLESLVTLIQISRALMKRIKRNYRFVTGFNGALILGGFSGLMMPQQSAILHNGSTLLLSLSSMTPLLKNP